MSTRYGHTARRVLVEPRTGYTVQPNGRSFIDRLADRFDRDQNDSRGRASRSRSRGGRGAHGRNSNQDLGFGYPEAGVLYAAVIAAIARAFFTSRMNGILAFWLAYILARPMGASFGGLLSQPVGHGKLGFGTVVTSGFFLSCIGAIVVCMTMSTERLETRRIR